MNHALHEVCVEIVLDIIALISFLVTGLEGYFPTVVALPLL
jgi:hypothetical protein